MCCKEPDGYYGPRPTPIITRRLFRFSMRIDIRIKTDTLSKKKETNEGDDNNNNNNRLATVPPHADELAADEMERGKNKEERRNELRTKTKWMAVNQKPEKKKDDDLVG